MDKQTVKWVRLSTEDVLLELENEDEPVCEGSDDEFDDMICEEKQRDEWGGIDGFSANCASTPLAQSSPSHSSR